MHTIDLAYVGRGLHEELAAYIADQENYYADEGVHVALRDGCDWGEERLRRGATIGLGRALLSRLTSGIPWVALTVNTHRPLFWFLARPGLTDLSDLAGHRLAVHPPHAAPGCFARIVLRWKVLAWVGDHFQIPTVGLAVDPTYIHPDDPAVAAVVRAHRRALKVIHNNPDTTVRYIQTFLGRHTADEARAHYNTFIAPHFTPDGQADLAVGAAAIAAVTTELGVPATLTAPEFYRTAH
ncbi:ABC transporter substrate-binding protein [Pseudonocardia sp.]|jgi:NitT/TauT family transport system substrate-binding protein|uniref:ABC transporter substrate-binding protein n=1 Tax=Pseudonocardia sp. TaxID=60912 RepID=UPI00261AA3FD|nr:ABC transporter substrate-binding protein [Pseudonocardia sp.]MCW2718301.1 transporter substrate-binding protein [Pseudonocardia sp.]MDT7615058.1 hypothetical protein [Pseudonocardiales bacterium]